MVVDHVGFYLLGNEELWRTFGRFSAPLFFFIAGFVARPIKPARDLTWRSPLSWLLPLGLILSTLNYFIWDMVSINILISLFVAKVLLSYWEPADTKPVWLITLVLVLYLLHGQALSLIQYGTVGLVYAIGGKLIAGNNRVAFARILLLVTVLVQFKIYYPHKEHLGFFITVAVILASLMMGFRFQQLPLFEENRGVARFALLVLSRYSLEIYFLHLAALQLLYLSWIYDY